MNFTFPKLAFFPHRRKIPGLGWVNQKILSINNNIEEIKMG